MILAITAAMIPSCSRTRILIIIRADRRRRRGSHTRREPNPFIPERSCLRPRRFRSIFPIKIEALSFTSTLAGTYSTTHYHLSLNNGYMDVSRMMMAICLTTMQRSVVLKQQSGMHAACFGTCKPCGPAQFSVPIIPSCLCPSWFWFTATTHTHTHTCAALSLGCSLVQASYKTTARNCPIYMAWHIIIASWTHFPWICMLQTN